MNEVRSFIAIELPATVRQQIEQVCTVLRQKPGSRLVRWVEAKNIHLTLQFLGDVRIADIPKIELELKGVAGLHEPFEIAVEGAGVFPGFTKPRVLWVGVGKPDSRANERLAALQKGIEQRLFMLGFQSDGRGFNPHLTIGRVNRDAGADDMRKIGEVVKSTPIGDLGVIQVEAVTLFRSDLKPGGPVYTRIGVYPLNSSRQAGNEP